MQKLFTAIVAIAIGITPVARAHDDPNKDASQCDKWQRTGHTHDQPDDSDIDLGDPLHTRIHSVYGDNYVTNDLGYLQVVGGSGYRGPDPEGNRFPGQGGFVQGEVDVAPGVPDADFNVAAFGPNADALPPADPKAIVAWASNAYGGACVNVAGQQRSVQTREP